MGAHYENIAVPFHINIGKCYLTDEQLIANPNLENFVRRFWNCFEYDPLTSCWIYLKKEHNMPVSINEPGTPAFEPISGAVTPEITALEPSSCAIGDADFDLVITGNNFTADTEIYFAGHPEPTTLHEDGTISTGVKPSLWAEPATVQCQVHTGTLISNAVDFEFTAPAEGRGGKGGVRDEMAPRESGRPMTPEGERARGDEDEDELVLTDIEPDSLPVGHDKSFRLTVTGEGFTRQCVIVFDDEEVPTKYISSTKLSADVPMADKPDEVDVEVHRGDEMSDVITFEFVAERSTVKRQPARKPKKTEPAHKRPKKKGR
jgi:hypothetical protein